MRAFFAGSFACLVLGCSDHPQVRVELSRCWPKACDSTPCVDAGVDAGVAAAWGSWAASLSVPSCIDGGLLIVNTLEGTLLDTTITAPPGPTLSLPEALWVARNRPGPDTIAFSESVFPSSAPGTIRLGSGPQLPQDLTEVCIDARNRGVIVDWAGLVNPNLNHIWGLTEGSVQIGLVLVNTPSPQYVIRSQVAGCRVGTDGLTASANGFFALTGTGAMIGPGNAIGGGAWFSDSEIFENDLNHDPLTHVTLPRAFIVRCDPPMVHIRNNVAAGFDLSLFRTGEVTMNGNSIGVDRQRRPVGGTSSTGISISGYASTAYAFIGPNNVITGREYAVTVFSPTVVQVAQNSIWGNTNGIASTAVSPPVIVSVDGGFVEGTCATPGLIELFSDRGNQGEIYMTSTTCGTTWQATVPRQPGRNVTATLTEAGGRAGHGTSNFSAPVSF